MKDPEQIDTFTSSIYTFIDLLERYKTSNCFSRIDKEIFGQQIYLMNICFESLSQKIIEHWLRKLASKFYRRNVSWE